MTPQNERTLRRLLRLPPVKWATAIAKLDSTAQVDISRAMEDDAQRCILLSGYLYSVACGGSHESAQKLASRKLAKVRRAMGFTYPEQGLPEASW